jgi:large subunit ribosomal protein L17
MRHRLAHRRLSRPQKHLKALLRNLATDLLDHEHIVTTVPKAKEVRPIVEHLITVAKRGVKADEPKGRTLAARRRVMNEIVNEDVVTKLFDELAPRFMDRPGGYTRILRLGHRRGDGGEIAQIELLGSEYDPKKAEAEKAAREAEGEAPKQQKSVGERLRAAAQNIRGGKKEAKAGDAARGKAGKPAKGAAKKTTTPRKAGGS